MSEKVFVAVAKLEDVPAGKRMLVQAGGIEILLCNTKDRIFAVRNLCSHADQRLDRGRIKDGVIVCPGHGARFDLETGEAMTAPAVMPLQTYEVRVDHDRIEIAV